MYIFVGISNFNPGGLGDGHIKWKGGWMNPINDAENSLSAAA